MPSVFVVFSVSSNNRPLHQRLTFHTRWQGEHSGHRLEILCPNWWLKIPMYIFASQYILVLWNISISMQACVVLTLVCSFFAGLVKLTEKCNRKVICVFFSSMSIFLLQLGRSRHWSRKGSHISINVYELEIHFSGTSALPWDYIHCYCLISKLPFLCRELVKLTKIFSCKTCLLITDR